MSASDAAFTPSRNAPAGGDARRRGTSGPESATNTNAGRKIPIVAAAAPPAAGEEVADERGGREHRAGRHLADGDRVEELRVGEPAEPLDEVRAEEGEQDVAGAVEDRADLEEHANRPANVAGAAAAPAARRERREPRQRGQRERAAPRGASTRSAARRRAEDDEEPRSRRAAPRPPPRRRASPSNRCAWREGRRTVRANRHERVRDDDEHDRLHAGEDRRDVRERAEAHVRPGERRDDERGRHDEAGAGDDEPRPARRGRSRGGSRARSSSGRG